MIDLSKSYEYFQPEKRSERVHIVGCGSVGSTVAENLARLGVNKFTLWDFDKVEPHNIANQMFVQKHIGKPKVEALEEIIKDINPDADVVLKPDGWNNNKLSGFIFLCVDSIEIRREIVEKHINNESVVCMTDFRTRLEDAQVYFADWSNKFEKDNFLNTMQFSHEEAMEETPVSACNITLGVCPTVRGIVAVGVSNFMNFWNRKPTKRLILFDIYSHNLEAY